MDKIHVRFNYQQKTLLKLLFLFHFVYLICAFLLQIRFNKPPTAGGGPLDIFTGGMFWLISIGALLIATIRVEKIKTFLLWTFISASAGALAIDEIFEFHEMTRNSLGDDDYIKIFFWLSALIGFIIAYHFEKPAKRTIYLVVIGFFIQTLWLIVDLGDGDFFTLPFSLNSIQWAEEIFELTATQFYFSGIILQYVIMANRYYKSTYSKK